MCAFLLLILAATAFAAKFNPLHHTGFAAPYFDAPAQEDVVYAIPEGCVVDQAAYFVRHGSRYPTSGSYAGWVSLYQKFQNATYTAKGPLSFIPSWTVPVDDATHQEEFLSSTGALEAFDLGVKLRKQYKLTPGGDNFTVWSAAQQRVLDTATFFARGYVSQGNYLSDESANRATVISLVDSATGAPYADSLTPGSSCPAFTAADNSTAQATAYRATYQNAIASRLNRYLEGNLVLNATDVGVMQDLCGFGYEVGGELRFCDIFTEDEWLNYEYALDLNYYYGSGAGNPFSATVGYPYVKAITDLFEVGPGNTVTNATLTPPPLIMGFTHDNNLAPVMSALGLWNTSRYEGVYPLSTKSPDPRREFRSSYLVAFRGYVALERLTCTIGGPSIKTMQSSGVFHTANDFGGIVKGVSEGKNATFVRVRADNAPVPIPDCQSGPGKTCPLDSFVEYVNGPRKEFAGAFDAKCNITNVKEVQNTVSFFTTSGDGNSTVIGVN